MDPGNSGSMQSSSGGDDQEFHSSSTRGASESISSFLNPQNSNTFTPQQQQHFNPFFNPQTLDFPLTTHHYNPPSNDQLINWSLTTTNTRSHSQLPQHQNYTNITTPSSSNTQPLLPTTTTTNTQTPFSNPRAEPEPLTYRAGPDQQLSSVIKNPKKRTRASRRAPTTVLTTDTTNFRQMVQEFTGIPAVPFSGSPYARRLDLFSSGLRPDAFGPIYPLRPAAQKFSNTPAAFANNATSLLDSNTNDNNNNNQNFTLASGDQLLNQQFQHHQVQNQNITLQNLMSGYNNPSQETTNRTESGQVVRGNDGNNRWRNNNSNDGVQENNNSMVVHQFDGNNNRNGDQNVQEEHVNVMSGSGYNLNLVSEKNVIDHQGNTAPWICNSD